MFVQTIHFCLIKIIAISKFLEYVLINVHQAKVSIENSNLIIEMINIKKYYTVMIIASGVFLLFKKIFKF